MNKHVLILACLACTGHGRQAQASSDDMPGEALARFLLGLSPAAAFSPHTFRSHLAVGESTSAFSHPVLSYRQSLPVMSRADGDVSRRDAVAFALASLAAMTQPNPVLAAAETSKYLSGNNAPEKRPDVKETVLQFDPGFIPGQKARMRSFEAWNEANSRRPRPEKKKNKVELVMLILRVKEATAQEQRLITTGKYKTLQRLNIKLAISFMIENYRLNDRFNEVSQYAVAESMPDKAKKQQQALNAGRKCMDALTDLSQNAADLVANALSPKEREFVLKRLAKISDNIDTFLAFLPRELLEEADRRIQEENRLNAEEYPKDEEMLNVDKAKDLKGDRSML